MGWTPQYECTRKLKGIMFEKVEKRFLPYLGMELHNARVK